MGDSITAGSPWDDDPAIGWPAAAAAADPRLRFTVRAAYGKFHESLEDPERPGRMREKWTVEGDHPSIDGYRRLGELAFTLP